MRTLAPLSDQDVIQLFAAAVRLEMPQDYLQMIMDELEQRSIEPALAGQGDEPISVYR